MKRHCTFLAFASSVALLCASVGTASADDRESPPPAYAPYFNGSFVEVGARGGLTSAAGSDYDGWTLDAGLRQSFPMLLGDTRLAYRYDRLGEDVGGAGPLEQHSVGLTGGLHPLYMVLLGSDWISYVISSFYLEVGLGAQYGVLDVSAQQTDETDWGFFWSLGTGIDIPLWDPDIGYAMWVNILYRFHSGDFDRTDGSEIDLPLHTGFVGLSFRKNGLLF